jgi:hypothetical protein
MCQSQTTSCIDFPPKVLSINFLTLFIKREINQNQLGQPFSGTETLPPRLNSKFYVHDRICMAGVIERRVILRKEYGTSPK